MLLADGTMEFHHRRWGIFDVRSTPLPGGRRVVEKGLFSPSLVHLPGEPDERKQLIFLPRYRGHETAIVRDLNFHGVRDHAVARGFTAVKSWLKGILSRGRKLETGG